MGTIGISDIMAREPCPLWSRKLMEATRKEAGLRNRASAQTLYRRLRGRIPDADLIWLLSDTRLVSERRLRLFFCDCAARALRRESRAGRKPDERSYAAVRVARRFAVGKATRDELAAAWAAARAAEALAVEAENEEEGEGDWPAKVAARTAAWAARATTEEKVAWIAAWAAAWAARATTKEVAWQLERLGYYVNGSDQGKAKGG